MAVRVSEKIEREMFDSIMKKSKKVKKKKGKKKKKVRLIPGLPALLTP